MGSKLGVVLEAVTWSNLLARCRAGALWRPRILFGSFSSSAVFLPAGRAFAQYGGGAGTGVGGGTGSGGTNAAPEGGYSAALGAGIGAGALPAWAPSLLPVVATGLTSSRRCLSKAPPPGAAQGQDFQGRP